VSGRNESRLSHSLKKYPSVIVCLLLTCVAHARDNIPTYFEAQPRVLAEVKARLAAGDKSLQPALDALVKQADAALNVAPPTVTQKTRLAPSGNVHDYASTAPYQWPNPNTANGLPYIRKDGQVYPGSRTGESDLGRIGMMSGTVQTLALAYYFTGNEIYAAHAAEFLRVWFLDPKTSMTPRLAFAQGIPGTIDGRAGGILKAPVFRLRPTRPACSQDRQRGNPPRRPR
jgi:hypothetical protein